jgi:hypothetical protein
MTRVRRHQGRAVRVNTVYLTRRNLLTLLNKLDRPDSSRTIIKCDTDHPKYPCTRMTAVIAVEDADYYTDRQAGPVHPMDEPVTAKKIRRIES